MPETALTIRAYRPEDLDAVIDIYLRAIREVASRDYTPAQVAAWAQADRAAWAVRRLDRPTWVAEIGGAAAGFSDLQADGTLDMMFVHPAHQGAGVATALCNTVEAAARARGLARINTEASLTARPFFERRGFVVVAAQCVEKRGETLRNFRMTKHLA